MKVDVEFRTPLGLAIAGGRAIIRLGGDLDLLAVRDLMAAVEVLLEQRIGRIDIHLGSAERVDSCAIEALASTHERLTSRGGRLGVVGASARVADDLRRRGLSAFLRCDAPDPRSVAIDRRANPALHDDLPAADTMEIRMPAYTELPKRP